MRFLAIPDRESSPLGTVPTEPQAVPADIPPSETAAIVAPPQSFPRTKSDTEVRRSSSFWSLSSRRSSSTASRTKPRRLSLLRSKFSTDLDVVWVQLLAHLSEDNLASVVSLLVHSRPSRKSGSQPALALIRVRTVLAILSTIQERPTSPGRKPKALSNSTARYLLAAVHAGSYDAAAQTVHMYYARRLNLPDRTAVETAVTLVEHGADAGHAGCQAVLGTLLCRTTAFGTRLEGPKAKVYEDLAWSEVSSPERSSRDGESDEAGGAKEKGRQGKRMRILVRGKDTVRGSILLRKAAGQGCALALDQFERAVLAEYEIARMGNREVSEEERGKMFTRVSSVLSVVSIDEMAGEEYAAAVQEGAERKVPHCAVRMSKVLRKGIGVARNIEAAAGWVRTAAELNVPSAISAAHADAVRENCQMTEVLCRERLGKEEVAAIRKKVRANRRLVRKYETDMGHWRQDCEELKEVLLLHNVCNLRGPISRTLCEAILRFIGERDRDGWGHYAQFFVRR